MKCSGGYAEGILGDYSSLGQITLIQGWNWYAGSEAAAITFDQYDFQTVVTHELGHALGLGHITTKNNISFLMNPTIQPNNLIIPCETLIQLSS